MLYRLLRLAGLNSGRQTRRVRSRQNGLRGFEALEDRSLLATFPAGFQDDVLATGLYEPTSMVVAPDGRIFVAEKPYGVRVVQNGQLLPTPFVTLPVERVGERGVAGVVLDPAFPSNGFVYVYYTRKDAAGSYNRLSRFTASSSNPNIADPASERVLIDGIPTSDPGWHNGGMLQFGADGMLYVGIGDTTNTALVQDNTKLQGKILRINPAAYPQIVPPDNPLVGIPGARGEIWAKGVRNPFTGAMQPGTNRLFVNDVGSGAFEEVNEIVRGGNFGWPLAEGTSSDPQFVNPLFAYPHVAGGGAAITGGVFYIGNGLPADFGGTYFFGDYVQGFIRRLNPQTGASADFGSDLLTPVDVDNAPDGHLYWLSLGFGGDTSGAIHHLRYVGSNRAPQAIATSTPSAGQPPLSVNFSGSQSSDPDGDPLTYAWDFGDGTTGSGVTTTHTYSSAGVYTARLIVNDGQASSSASLTITVGNSAPVATITAPVANTTYAGGNIIVFAGTGSDLEDGTLPASAFEWRVVFHHNVHTHPFIDSIPGVTSSQIQIPISGEPDANQWFRIHLTVTDSGGLTHSTFTDVRPQTATFTLKTSPAGGSVLLDGQPMGTPSAVLGVVGMTRTLSAPTMQLISGRMYKFSRWSDGGALTHTISTPSTATTFTATYAAMARAATYTSAPPAVVQPGQSLAYSVTIKNVGTETWRNSGTTRVRLGVYFGGESDAIGAWTSTPLRVTLPRNVSPGQSVTVQVRITAPTAPGTYVLRHRMVKETNNWFETMQKTAVTVLPAGASMYSGNPPAVWTTREVLTYPITLTNTTAELWPAAGTTPVRLGVYFGGASDDVGAWTDEPQRFDLPHDVPPGGSATLNVAVRAPSMGGSYTLRQRLVREGVNWFSEMLKTSATVETLAAGYAGSPPTAWLAGQEQTWLMTVTNTGTSTWLPSGAKSVNLGVYFAGQSDAVGDWPTEPVRMEWPAGVTSVSPGQSITFTVRMTAPTQPGSYVLRHRMVKEYVAWFDEMLRLDVVVG